MTASDRLLVALCRIAEEPGNRHDKAVIAQMAITAHKKIVRGGTKR